MVTEHESHINIFYRPRADCNNSLKNCVYTPLTCSHTLTFGMCDVLSSDIELLLTLGSHYSLQKLPRTVPGRKEVDKFIPFIRAVKIHVSD